MRALVFVLLVACSSKHGTTTNGSGTGTPPAGCDGTRKKVEQLYRAEATANPAEKPARVEEAVADNTAMVMAECAQAPDRVVPCIDRVSSAAELEKQCLAPLDEEGSEGEALRK